MGSIMPTRRLVQPAGALQCLHHLPIRQAASFEGRRTIFNFFRNRGKKNEDRSGASNPVLDEFLKKKPTKENQLLKRGDLSSSSIFDSDRKIQEREQAEEKAQATKTETKVGGNVRNKVTMAAVLDPRPRPRERWQRKMVIREMQKGGRLTRQQYIKRTERESTSRSVNFKTSIKKLGPLARQIQGKTVDEAISQMRFSKKKVAKDVLEYLEYARDNAIVSRGMGLGAVESAQGDAEGVVGSKAVAPAPVEIQLKDGKRYKVTEPTKIYVDQAWVGRGPFGMLPDYRARGQVNMMRTPWTSISVVLKEEATRIREYKEREAKRQRERVTKVWTPLPDRPISGQRQWFSW